ncbi:MAG: T9SS type A sorting domain-containing protein [Ignavibacteriae bacterium]|nr:T9SS type A sorting domain-containing protein [Ignavibacteriota bacterium]
MRYCFLLCALITVLSVTNGQTRIDARVEVDSVMREFIVSVPTGPAPAGGYPLVFMFHGTSQNGEIFYQDSQWKEKGEAQKFITVFPTALRYCVIEDGQQRTTTKWHNGEAEEISCPGQYMKSDIHFVRTMLDSIMSRFNIDRRRMYASGFSNGMGFASKLAVEMSDVFAAVAGCGSILSAGDSAKPKRNIPVWTVIGTLDDKWLKAFEGLGLTEFPFNDTTFFYFSRPIHRYIGTFNLADTYTRTEAGRTITYRYSTPASSEPSTEFRFTLVNNMFHVYPNGNNIQFVAADIFWDFFSQYSSPTGTRETPSQPGSVMLYPNPVHDVLHISGAGSATLVLRNLLGQEVLRSTVENNASIRLPRLPGGIYSAEFITGTTRTARTISVK